MKIGVIQASGSCVVSGSRNLLTPSVRNHAPCSPVSPSPGIGVDRSSDSEVFRVTRGIGEGCSICSVAFPVAFRFAGSVAKITAAKLPGVGVGVV